MTLETAKQLIDLYLDDELPVELVSEFKQVMFESTELREEVAELRRTKEMLLESFKDEEMTDSERIRVFAKICADSGITTSETLHIVHQLTLPIQNQGSKEAC